ncbi:MAG: ABC transporter permease, partial [Myxococcota bacterium]
MSRLPTLLSEAYHEARSGLTSPLTWVMFALLAGYMVLVLSHAGYLREIGAVDVARNSPHVLYLMVAGQAFWLFMVWAWVYAQPVVRDRAAQMHEMVLAAPVPVGGLLFARYLGATVTALVIACSGPLAAATIEPLGAIGAYDPGTVMPTPWGALGWAWLCLAVPTAFGYGALFLVAAIRTRSTAGPFAVATAMVLLWMAAMVILKSGDIDPLLAAVIDPSGYAEVEFQVLEWTPAERMSSWLEWTPALVVNRLVWGALPLGLLAVALATTRREHLVLERAPRDRRSAEPVPVKAGPLPASPTGTSWVRATLDDARWQLGLALRGPGLWVAAGLLLTMGVAGGFVHILGHARGPILPRAELVGPLVAEFQYMVVAFVILAVVGAVFRRDDGVGFSEMLDACPAPPSVRFVGSVLTAATLVVGFSLLPALSSTLLVAGFASSEAAWATPWIYQLVVMAPAILEIGAVVVFCHAALRSPGLAYGLSVATVFILVINHELDVVSYPTVEFAIPSHIEVSGLTGWAPWAGLLLVAVSYKLAVSAVVVGLGYLLVVRGVEGDLALRGSVALQRLRGGAGAVVVVAMLVAIGAA